MKLKLLESSLMSEPTQSSKLLCPFCRPSNDQQGFQSTVHLKTNSMIFFSRSLLYISLIICFLVSGCDSGTIIVNGLEEKDVNEMIVLLNNHRLAAEKKASSAGTGANKIVMWNLSVPSSKRIEALSILNVNGLPRKRGETLLSLFSKQGLVSSEMEERVRYQAGLADQIANTIRKIDGVLDTDVQLSIPEEDALPGQTNEIKEVTASVYIKHSGILDDPNAHLEIKIKRLVAGSIPGLNLENVTVIGDNTKDREVVINSSTSADDLLTSIWGIRLTKSSQRSFRMLFGLFMAIILGLMAALGWLMWKLQSLFTSADQLKSLLSPVPYELKNLFSGDAEKKSDSQDPESDSDSERPQLPTTPVGTTGPLRSQRTGGATPPRAGS